MTDRARVLHQLEREAIERALLEIENCPRRVACELVLLRRLREAVMHRDRRGLVDWRAIWRAIERIPEPEAIERWDEIVHAADTLLEAAPSNL